MDITNKPIYFQWSYNRNGTLNPKNVSSKQKVWWVCELGHEWETTIASRVYNTTGCPVCAGSKLESGFNDLGTKYPSIAAQWHPTRNKTLPSQHFPRDTTIIWWVCEQGHEWEAQIAGRVKNPEGNCLKCVHQKPTSFTSKLGKTNPHLEKFWHSSNKQDIFSIPTDSETKYVWVCEKGHKWEETPHNITRRKNVCQQCTHLKKIKSQKEILQSKKIQNLDTIESYIFSKKSNQKYVWLCEKGHTTTSTYLSIVKNKTSCTICGSQKYRSEGEQQVSNFIHSILPNFRIDINNKNFLQGKELDIYVPEKNLAIEFNGLYWHSEATGKTKAYHYDKWLACKNQGVQLIQIWEDDWERNPELVKQMLAHKLGVTTQPKVYARNTVITDVTLAETTGFLNNNHIQGSIPGSIKIGLKEKTTGTLVAVLVLKKVFNSSTYEILRYATSGSVMGGFTKLLNHFEKQYQPESVVTFSDNTVSNGGLYSNNGFIAVKSIKPDYMYIVKGVRVHKFGYRLKRFRNDPQLQYAEGLTEKELAQLNNISRIWDAGKIKWEKTF